MPNSPDLIQGPPYPLPTYASQPPSIPLTYPVVLGQTQPPTPYGMPVLGPGQYTQNYNDNTRPGPAYPGTAYGASGDTGMLGGPESGSKIPGAPYPTTPYDANVDTGFPGNLRGPLVTGDTYPPPAYQPGNQTTLSQPEFPIYLFKINLQSVDRYGWLQPNRTTLDGNEVVSEESETAATRSTWLTSLFSGVENIAHHDGDYIRAYGAKAEYLLKTYVTGSPYDVLIHVPDLGFVGPNSDLGSNWLIQEGSFTVDAGNQARGVVVGPNAATYVGISAQNPNVSAYVKLQGSPSTVGLIARNQDANDVSNCYTLELSSTGFVKISKIVAGVVTSLASSVTTLKAGMLEFSINGTTLNGYFNGVLVVTVVDSTFTGPGGVGIIDLNGGGLISQFMLTY
jgi:hypothetical protein